MAASDVLSGGHFAVDVCVCAHVSPPPFSLFRSLALSLSFTFSLHVCVRVCVQLLCVRARACTYMFVYE